MAGALPAIHASHIQPAFAGGQIRKWGQGACVEGGGCARSTLWCECGGVCPTPHPLTTGAQVAVCGRLGPLPPLWADITSAINSHLSAQRTICTARGSPWCTRSAPAAWVPHPPCAPSRTTPCTHGHTPAWAQGLCSRPCARSLARTHTPGQCGCEMAHSYCVLCLGPTNHLTPTPLLPFPMVDAHVRARVWPPFAALH